LKAHRLVGSGGQRAGRYRGGAVEGGAQILHCDGPLPSGKGTARKILKTLLLKMAQVEALHCDGETACFVRVRRSGASYSRSYAPHPTIEARSPKPETRNLDPRTRHPKPRTRNPRNPKPETGNPNPETRNPKPETRNPKPKIRNPKPETRNPKSEIRNPRLESLGQIRAMKQQFIPFISESFLFFFITLQPRVE